MALKTKYSPLQKLTLDNVYDAFSGLAPREKIIALSGLGVVILVLLFLPFSLVSGKLRSMQREIANVQGGYREVMQKIGEYKAARTEIESFEKRFGGGGSITSRLENIAKKVGLTVDQLKEQPPQETDYMEINAAEVKISGASLQQLTEFFYEIENDTGSLMRIRRLQIKPKSANRQLLDVSCEVATFAVKKEA